MNDLQIETLQKYTTTFSNIYIRFAKTFSKSENMLAYSEPASWKVNLQNQIPLDEKA